MSREDHSAFAQAPGLPRREWELERIEDLGEPAAICECCGIKEIRYVHVLGHRDVQAPLRVGSECAKDLLRDPEIANEADRAVRNFAARRAKFPSLASWRTTKDGQGERTVKGKFVFIVKQGNDGRWRGAARVNGTPGRDWPFGTSYHPTAAEAKRAIYDAVFLPDLEGPAIARSVEHARDPETKRRKAEAAAERKLAEERKARREAQERWSREYADRGPFFNRKKGGLER